MLSFAKTPDFSHYFALSMDHVLCIAKLSLWRSHLDFWLNVLFLLRGDMSDVIHSTLDSVTKLIFDTI